MSLWYPTRQFPPLPHAETHLKGGSDEVLNLTNINNAIGFSIESHADRHGYGGADPVSLDARQIVSGTLSLDRIPDSLTGKDADLWDGKHRWDDQTIGGNVAIGGDLRVYGDNIKDSGGNTRIILGDPVKIDAKLQVNANCICNSAGRIQIGLGDTNLTLRTYSTDVSAMINRLVIASGSGADVHQFEWYHWNGGILMILDNEGDLWIKGSLAQGCLEEYKSAMGDISDSDFLYVLEKTPVHWFILKEDSTRIRLGFIAEKVPFGFQVYRNDKLIGIDIVSILAATVGAVKQLAKKVKELEKRINPS